MTATYSGDPSSSDLDKVRFLIGDTNMSDVRFSNEEITFLLSEWTDPYLAAAEGAQQLSATASNWMDFTADGNSLSLDQMQAKYSLLSFQLRAQYNRRNRAVPWNAQASRGEFEAYENDDSVQPSLFAIAMHDEWDGGINYGGATPEDLRGENGW